MADNTKDNSANPEMDMEDRETRWTDTEPDLEEDLLDLDPEELAEQEKGNGQDYLLDAATLLDSLMLASGSEDITDDMGDYTDDPEVLQDFIERQQFTAAPEELYSDLIEHNSLSPKLSGGDLDARWQETDQSGEESVGGTVMTPDQDVVDELGEAVGVEYDDDEPLHTYDKLSSRDQNRWELNPASADETEDENPAPTRDEDNTPRRHGARRKRK